MEQDAKCRGVPPQQRDQLRVAEWQTRVYHLTLRWAAVCAAINLDLSGRGRGGGLECTYVTHSKTVIGDSLGTIDKLCFLETSDSVPAPAHSVHHSLSICRSGHAMAAYKTVPLRKSRGMLRPEVTEDSDWTPACSETDTNCLSCRPM